MRMYTLLPQILNMSLTASIVIVIVLLTRLPLKKAPKIFSYTLWAVVLFRLVCPVSFSSPLSLIGLFNAPVSTASGSIYSSMNYIPADIVHTESPQVISPLPGISDVINSNLHQGNEQLVADPLEAPMAVGTLLWLLGIVAMLIHSAISLIRLRRKLIGAGHRRDNIFLADHIASPFVIGLFRPKIYLPSSLPAAEQSYVILHEQTHIRRLDHIFKMLAFLALSVHWFNPFVWVAFICCVKDMEMSCDECVLKQMGGDIKGAYAASLLSLATGRRLINGSPLAFGEGNIKGRIKNVINFKKPPAWGIVFSLLVVAIAAGCLLPNPVKTAALPGASSPGTVHNFVPKYSFDKSLYMNPMSSYIPFDGTGELYQFSPDVGFTIINEKTGEVINSAPVDWTGKEVDITGWNSLFDVLEPVDISAYSMRRQYDAGNNYRIYKMDNEVWLANLHGGRLWSLYKLKDDFIMVAYVDETLSETEARALQRTIEQNPNVKYTDFVTREEALKRFEAKHEDKSLFEKVDSSIFRHRFIIHMRDISMTVQAAQDISHIAGIAKVSVSE